MPIVDVVDVVFVRDLLVPAIGTVGMRVLGVDEMCVGAFVPVPVVGVVRVAIVGVVDMIPVGYCRMTAVRTVLVAMIGMWLVGRFGCHLWAPFVIGFPHQISSTDFVIRFRHQISSSG
jgi:hypothetical protein